MDVKCKGCGNKINRDTAFKVIIKNKNNYYCSEQEYNDVKIEKESREQVIILIQELMGKTTNTILFKELKIITDIYGNKRTLDYLIENKINLKSIMNKSFQNEFAKIKYFFAIIKNNIGDFVKIQKIENKNNISVEYIPILYKQKIRKKSLSEYMNDYIEEEMNI